MLQFMEYAQSILDTFLLLGDWLTEPRYNEFYGDYTVAGLILGAGLIGVLTYKLVKFVVDLF